MSKLLINESPLQVQPSLAQAIGLNEAIFLQQLHYWLGVSKFVRGEKKWVYNTYDEWLDQFKYMSLSTLKRTIKSLKDQGLLCVEQFDNKRSNQVNYYAVNYEALNEIEKNNSQVVDSIDEVKMNQCNGSKRAEALGQNEPMDEVKMNQSPLGQNEPIYNTRDSQETSQKNSKKKNQFDSEQVELPVNVDRDLWIQFVEMRNSIKKPLTENAVKLILKKLVSYGQRANDSLEYSIIGNYQGLFAPKEQAVTKTQQPQKRRRFGSQDQPAQMRDVRGECA